MGNSVTDLYTCKKFITVTTMVVVESLVDYRRSDSFEDEGLEDSHATSMGEEVSPNAAKQEKGKVLYTRDDKGKTRQREFMPRTKCFPCDVRIWQGNALRGRRSRP